VTCTPRHRTVPLRPELVDDRSGTERAEAFRDLMATRRSVRDFGPDPVPFATIEAAVAAAGSAPSGANLQPWRFVVVSDPAVKRAIREGAEAEERAFYESRASDEWLAALEPLGTDWRKPFLETAPYVVVVMEVHKGPHSPRPYYVKESVGIAVGLFLAALHHAGLATLTHTPSPMRFLNEILGRPLEERPFVVVPVGHPAPEAEVPAITRKPLTDVLVHLEAVPTS
jgi:nitroreductase